MWWDVTWWGRKPVVVSVAHFDPTKYRSHLQSNISRDYFTLGIRSATESSFKSPGYCHFDFYTLGNSQHVNSRTFYVEPTFIFTFSGGQVLARYRRMKMA